LPRDSLKSETHENKAANYYRKPHAESHLFHLFGLSARCLALTKVPSMPMGRRPNRLAISRPAASSMTGIRSTVAHK
jgi:hypothetical protein